MVKVYIYGFISPIIHSLTRKGSTPSSGSAEPAQPENTHQAAGSETAQGSDGTPESPGTGQIGVGWYCSPPVGSSHRRRRVRGKEEERGRGREQAVTGRAAVTVEMQTV